MGDEKPDVGPALLPPANLRGTTDQPSVHLTWTAPGGEAPSGYVVERDGEESARVGGSVTTFDDQAVSRNVTAPTSLTATQGTLPGIVRLEWQASTTLVETHEYTVVALYGPNGEQRSAPSNVARGSFAAPALTGYEFSRDGGLTWQPAGADATYDDVAPPAGLLVATSTARFDPSRGLVRVSLDSAPVLLHASPSTYRVRAVTSAGTGPASEPASGFAGIGSIIAYQWQRSLGDSDTDYSDVPEVTGATWVDVQAPLDAARYYRSVMTAAGASGMSQPSRVQSYTVRSISAGGAHGCALLSNGKVVCWGDNSQGQATAPSDDFQSVSAGGAHTCAVRADNGLRCWGNDSTGQLTESDYFGVVSVSAGSAHTCAVRTNGQVFCWGDNTYGQASAPAGQYLSVAAGSQHTCGIRSDYQVACWGDNGYGQAPPLRPGAFSVIAAAQHHSCGIDSSGSIVCWGLNSVGEALAKVPGPFRSVSTGPWRTCGVLETGKLRCWGQNLNGETPTDPPTDTFQTPPPTGPFDSVACGSLHTCGLRRDGRVLCWGDNTYSQAPPLPPLGTYQAISLGAEHTCAIGSDGHVACWGYGLPNTPPLPSSDTFQAIAAGNYYTCGVRSDGKAVCWGGLNSAGEGSPPAEDTFKSLAADWDHTCGLRSDNTIRCWGNDVTGQVSTVPPYRFRAVSAGTYHSCGILLADGGVLCWGDNALDQAPSIIPPGPYVSLSSLSDHNCAVNGRAELYCWGHEPQMPALQPPSGTFASVSVGQHHACAVRSLDQRVVCWGDNSLGQAPDSPTIDSYQSIAAGPFHTCGIRLDQRIVCWGKNVNHQAPRPGP